MAKEEAGNQLAGSQARGAAPHAGSSNSAASIFEIQVRGQLDKNWSDWLDGLEVTLLDNGEMILFGPIVDQAALLGILNKLGRLNLALISVNEIKKENG